jgi:hypothetical protein
VDAFVVGEDDHSRSVAESEVAGAKIPAEVAPPSQQVVAWDGLDHLKVH